MEGCARKEVGRRFSPMLCGRHAKRFLALEMMEKRALRHRGGLAKLVDRGRGEALLADRIARCFEKAYSGAAAFRITFRWSWHEACIPYGRYARNDVLTEQGPMLATRDAVPIALAKAKKLGVYKGRKPSIDVVLVKAMRDAGTSPTTIARELKVARSSIYRLL
jgi:hypothetical protein